MNHSNPPQAETKKEKALAANRLSPYLICALALIIALALGAGIGAVAIPPLDLFAILASRLPFVQIQPTWSAAFETILFDIRLPRTLLVAITGAALAGSGAAYQGLFRNPLADPYLIGVASGAGLGAVLAMSFQWSASLGGMAAIPLAAFVGALLTVALVYSLARVGRSAPVTTLILAGVATSAFTGALSTFLMLQSQEQLRRAIAWTLGGFAFGGWQPVLVLLPYTLVGLGVIILLGRSINVLQFGEDQARQMGLNVERVKLALVLAASLTTAAAVSFSGIIGFVGLAVPHLVRLLWGGDYRQVVPLSVLAGGAILLVADVLARVVLAPEELPLGIVTALAGAPFFLWLLRRAKQQSFW